jgi:hypothetical protein
MAASKMTPAQTAEAQRLAREWKPGGGESVICRFQSLATIPIPSGEGVKVGVAAVDIGAVVKAIMLLGRFFQTAVYVEMNTPEVSPEIFRPSRLRGFDPLVDEIQKGVVFFPDHLVLPAPVDFLPFGYYGISGRNLQERFTRRSSGR